MVFKFLEFSPVFSCKSMSKIGLVIAGISCMALSACSTSDEEVIDVQKPTFQQTMYDLTSRSGGTDLLAMAGNSAGPNVKVFSLDGAGADTSLSGVTLTPPEGGVATNDPSVEVFPLDDPKASSDVERADLNSGAPGSDELLSQPSGTGASPKSPDFVSIAAPGEPLVRIYFAHDSSDLDVSAMGDISAVSARFNPNRDDYVLSVEGHASQKSSEADPVKRRIANMRIATDRAYNVARALMEAGIAPEKIRTVSWGESMPAKAHDGLDADAASRRVEIFQMK